MFGPPLKEDVVELPAKSSKKPPDETWVQRIMTQWWKSAIDNGEITKVDPSRNEFLRPSALPFCPLKVAYTRITEGVETERFRSFNENFYTDIGHAVHALAQDYIGRMAVEQGVTTKVETIGHWKCPKCNKRRRFTTYKRCKCGGRPHYEEIEIKWRTTVGHIDKVLRIGHMLFILDYKTCGTYAIRKHREAKRAGGEYLPYNANRAQITRYTGLFEKVFHKLFRKGGKFEGCVVMGSILAYISRETVREREFVYLHSNAKIKEKQYRKACRDDKDFVRMKGAVANKDKKVLLELIKEKPCKSREQYEKNFHSPFDICPLASVCFKGDKLEAKVMKAIKPPKKKR